MELMIKIFKYFVLFILLVLGIFFANQIILLTRFLQSIHPLVAQIFLIIFTLSILYLIIILYLKIKRYPRSLEKPNTDNEKELELYKEEVIKRLNNNKILQVNGIYPENDADIVDSVKILDKEAEKIITDNASWVFISTAISQNGKLDGLITLFLQLRMIYNISRIYYQKPRIKELYKLYANVILTVFLVTRIEDINISEHLEPVISKFTPAKMIGSIPAVGSGIGLLTNMLFDGATNCFLTLRIGYMTREYCDFLNFDSHRNFRKKATNQAASRLGKIISRNSGKITKAFFKVVTKVSANTARSTTSKIKSLITKPFAKGNEEVAGF